MARTRKFNKLKQIRFDVPDENATIWRYMDFTEFIDMLNSSGLFFIRVDKLGDDFEGSCPKANLKCRLDTFKRSIGRDIEADSISEFYKLLREFNALNCWHINEYESAAMWTLYLKSNEGIAIRSTFKRLRDSFIDQKPDMIYKIQYIDYEEDKMPIHFLAPYIHKRKSFEHEVELRAIIQRLPKCGFSKRSKRPFEVGTYLTVDLQVLIDKICLAPRTPDWQFELVSAVTEKFGLEKSLVKRSDLDKQPIY